MENGVTGNILNFFGNLIPFVVSNSSQIFGYLLNLGELFGVFLWFYCGYYLFNDSQKRYTFESRAVYYVFLVMGLITGPIGLIFYILTRPRFTFDELEFMKVEHKFYYHQASKVLDCIKCGAYVLEDHSHCTNCGTQNRFECVKCKALTDYDDMYCNNCGHHFDKRYEELYNSIIKQEQLETRKVKKSSSKKLDLDSLKSSYDLKGSLNSLKSKASNVYSRVSSKAKSVSAQASSRVSSAAKAVKNIKLPKKESSK